MVSDGGDADGAGALAFAARLMGGEVADLERAASEGYGGPGELLFFPISRVSGPRTTIRTRAASRSASTHPRPASI